MARRKTVRKAADEIRAEHPTARVEVLYDPQAGWGRANALEPLPESEWSTYRVDRIEWHDGGLCVIEAS